MKNCKIRGRVESMGKLVLEKGKYFQDEITMFRHNKLAALAQTEMVIQYCLHLRITHL